MLAHSVMDIICQYIFKFNIIYSKLYFIFYIDFILTLLSLHLLALKCFHCSCSVSHLSY